MKPVRAFLLLALFASLARPASAAETTIETVDSTDVYNQLVTLQVAPFRPAAAVISNGSYVFNYGDDSLDTTMLEAGWSVRLVDTVLGEFHLEENLAVTSFSGNVQAGSLPAAQNSSLTVNLVGFDTRLMYGITRFPWRRFMPFAEGGYQRTFYFQSGRSDLDSAQGSVGNFVAGAGFRLWLNRGTSITRDYVNHRSAIPLFLTARVNRIFPQDGGLNLASTSYFGGISVGL